MQTKQTQLMPAPAPARSCKCHLAKSLKAWAWAAMLGVSLPLTLTLSGCQQTIEGQALNTDPAYWQNMQSRLAALQQVHLRGRFVYASNADRFSANFDYQYTGPGSYTLTLRSSLGSEIAKLIVTPQQAKLQASSREYTDTNPRGLFADAFDIQIPFEVLPQLIIGQGLANSIYTKQGILYKTTVDNFTVIYADYNSYGDIALPKDFTVQSSDMKLTLLTREVLKLE